MVDGPAHVKKLTVPQLQELAGEIRTELIEGLAKGGGHLGPNLGVVELSIALHKVFTTPKDKFVWDVSHQVYVHKILTGRKDRFRTIRQTDGLNGFALRTESEHDSFGAGHAGTALSAALGMAAARDKRGSNEMPFVSAASPKMQTTFSSEPRLSRAAAMPSAAESAVPA